MGNYIEIVNDNSVSVKRSKIGGGIKIKSIYSDLFERHTYIHILYNSFFIKKRLNLSILIWSCSVDALHDASPVLEILHGLHLLGHSQNLVEAGAESRHVLEVGFLLHLHRQVVHACVLQDGCHLEGHRGSQSQKHTGSCFRFHVTKHIGQTKRISDTIVGKQSSFAVCFERNATVHAATCSRGSTCWMILGSRTSDMTCRWMVPASMLAECLQKCGSRYDKTPSIFSI